MDHGIEGRKRTPQGLYLGVRSRKGVSAHGSNKTHRPACKQGQNHRPVPRRPDGLCQEPGANREG